MNERMIPRKYLALVLVLALASMGVSCPKDKLKKAAVYGKAATEELGEVQQLAIRLNSVGQLEDAPAAAIVRGVLKANAALQSAKNTVDRIQVRIQTGGEFTEQDQIALQDLFAAFNQAAVELVQSGAAGINNPESKAQIIVLLTSIQQFSERLLDLWQ